MASSICFIFFFFNDTATTEIYTLSLHDALPISFWPSSTRTKNLRLLSVMFFGLGCFSRTDRKSTRLNSSHLVISYAVFCLKKKKEYQNTITDGEYISSTKVFLELPP